jgi:hypothetical protein
MAVKVRSKASKPFKSLLAQAAGRTKQRVAWLMPKASARAPAVSDLLTLLLGLVSNVE